MHQDDMWVRNKLKINISHIDSYQWIVSKDMHKDALRTQLRNICTSVRMEMIRSAEDLHFIEKMIMQDTLNKKITQTTSYCSDSSITNIVKKTSQSAVKANCFKNCPWTIDFAVKMSPESLPKVGDALLHKDWPQVQKMSKRSLHFLSIRYKIYKKFITDQKGSRTMKKESLEKKKDFPKAQKKQKEVHSEYQQWTQ